MDLPFNVQFRQFGKVIPVLSFFNSEKDVELLEENQFVSITENLDLEVKFESENESGKFYMEGLDLLSFRETDMDEDGVYIRPTTSFLTIFDSKKAESHSPFIPGIYLLKVIIGTKKYYSGIKIVTKQMSNNEWEVMKQEIENYFPGFTIDKNRKSQLLQSSRYKSVEGDLQNWYQLIQGIIENPKSSIISPSVYKRGNHRRSTMQEKKELTYNIVENQWFKMILMRILSSFNQRISEGQKEPQLVKFRNYISQVLQSTWLQEVEMRTMKTIPPSFLFDKRYRLVYEGYRLLKNQKNDGKQYHVSKRTDLLYETWCYLQIIEVLISKEVGFQLKVEAENTHMYILEEMKKNEGIELYRENLRIHIVYDGIIPNDVEETSRSCPLYTSSIHNRPDTRLDVWKENKYCGSVLIDYKYRPLIHIWDSSLLKMRKPNRVMIQLDSYKSQIRSKYLGDGKGIYLRMNPVVEVWALYPRGSQGIQNPLNDYGIHLLRLNPKEVKDELKENLIRVINQTTESISIRV